MVIQFKLWVCNPYYLKGIVLLIYIYNIARDPKTAAFAKALQSMPEDPQGLDLSDHELQDDMMQDSDGDDEDDDGDLDPKSNLSLVIPEDEVNGVWMILYRGY